MIKKLINILLVVIIPLFVAFGVGVYGYNRYTSAYTVKSEKKGYYDSRIEEKNTESEIIAYLDFYTTNYKEIYTKDVKNKDEKSLFTLKVYATYYVTENNGEETKSLDYMFFAYNMNYGNLYKEIYTSTSADQQLGAYMPTLSIKLIDHDKAIDSDEDNDLSSTLSLTPLSIVEIVDYNWVGYTKDGVETKKNSNGKTITFTDTGSTTANAKVGTFSANKEYSNTLDMEISVTDPQYSSYDESTVVVFEDTLENVCQRVKEFDTEGTKAGYAEDIYEAGYFKYAFTRYIWWEALIALVLTLIVTVATSIVWNYTDDKVVIKTTKENK